MAKATTRTSSTSGRKKPRSSTRSTGTAVARRPAAASGDRSDDRTEGVGDAFVKLLQSPLVAELMAVAATAALAALAEHGFSTGGNGRGKRAGRAVKEAGKAAAAAVGRRLANEFDEIRESAKQSTGSGSR